MRTDDPNLPYLLSIAKALGELREQVVFVGGAVAGLLITDPLADPVRATWMLCSRPIVPRFIDSKRLLRRVGLRAMSAVMSFAAGCTGNPACFSISCPFSQRSWAFPIDGMPTQSRRLATWSWNVG